MKKIRITSARGTTSYCINYSPKIGFLNQSPYVKKQLRIHSTEKLVCNTCKREMDSEICRVLFTRNIVGEPQFFSFHFFSPCWYSDDFSQKYPNLIVDKCGISILENHSISENGIKDLQTNLSYWL